MVRDLNRRPETNNCQCGYLYSVGGYFYSLQVSRDLASDAFDGPSSPSACGPHCCERGPTVDSNSRDDGRAYGAGLYLVGHAYNTTIVSTGDIRSVSSSKIHNEETDTIRRTSENSLGDRQEAVKGALG